MAGRVRVVQVPDRGAARVVDQHVQPAVGVGDAGEQRVRGRRFAQVGGEVAGRSAVRPDRCVRRTAGADDDVGAGAQERPGDTGADAARAAGDDGDAAVQRGSCAHSDASPSGRSAATVERTGT